MAMKSAKNTHYLQIDNKIEKICGSEGIEILPAKTAWEKYAWARKYFIDKPKTGYFIHVQKQPDHALSTCVSVSSRGVKQEMQNLMIIEENLKVSIKGVCNSIHKSFAGSHQAKGKIIVKQGAEVNYQQIHSWGKKNTVDTDYQFYLEKNSHLDHKYQVALPPKKLKASIRLTLLENAVANLETTASCAETEFDLKDVLMLKGKNASGMIKLRLAAGKNSLVSAYSQVRAEAEAKGHLDCQGLLLDKTAKVSLVPGLICSNKKAQITHEASIGKVSEEELNYLQMRGLTEKQALELIVNGFLQ